MKETLNRLFAHEKLSRQEACQVLKGIATEQYPSHQVAAFMTVYRMRPISIPELQGFRDALLELAVPCPLHEYESLDIVGTGGDGKDTFNVSTTAALVVAGAGYKVTKHGSVASSSSVGSSNLLMELGVKFTNDTDALRRCLDKAGICFLHAPLFHPALKSVGAIRRELGVRTFFNSMGPLVNPIQPRYQLFGTATTEQARLYQYVMEAEKGRNFSIVHSLDGYDEISLTGNFFIRTREGQKNYSPLDLGLKPVAPAALHGGKTAVESVAITMRVLENTCTNEQKQVVAVNAGAAIHGMQPRLSFTECIALALESIESGKALTVLQKLLAVPVA